MQAKLIRGLTERPALRVRGGSGFFVRRRARSEYMKYANPPSPLALFKTRRPLKDYIIRASRARGVAAADACINNLKLGNYSRYGRKRCAARDMQARGL